MTPDNMVISLLACCSLCVRNPRKLRLRRNPNTFLHGPQPFGRRVGEWIMSGCWPKSLQGVPAFQAGPAPAAAVPKHEASSPNPRLRRIARRGVESREGRRARGAVAANFPPGPAGRPTLDPGADPLPSGPPSRPGGLRGKEAASPVRSGSYWSGIRKQATAAFPLPTNGLL